MSMWVTMCFPFDLGDTDVDIDVDVGDVGNFLSIIMLPCSAALELSLVVIPVGLVACYVDCLCQLNRGERRGAVAVVPVGVSFSLNVFFVAVLLYIIVLLCLVGFSFF